MKTKDYRPLPDCLKESGGFGAEPVKPEGKLPPEIPEHMKAVMAREEQAKKARLPYVEKCKEGFAVYGEKSMPYRLFVPEALEPGRKYPMVVFLHGGGERGTDNTIQMTANDGACIWIKDQLEGDGESCFVFAAQCPGGEFGWMEEHLLAASNAMDAIIDEYPVDETRLYLTGMSMGGGGCWRMNYMFPERFAAVVPMCSAAGVKNRTEIIPEAIEYVADAFLNKPLWLFHAADDFVVTPETTRSLVKALEARGKVRGQDFFYTEYPAECGYNHGCWNPAYEWKLMRQWMFQQTTTPAPAFGPPEGAEPPFPMMDMEEMMRKEAIAREARKAWLPRFRSGKAACPDATVPYLLYVPENAPQNLPLVVVLHGIGGCGCDNLGQLTDNDAVIDWIKAQDNGLLEKSYILAPQCPMPIPNLRWETEYLDLVAKAIEEITEKYAIDQNRIYLTGLSLGGYGAWNLNRMYPDRFAAVVPCCPACVVGSQMNNRIYDEGIDACAESLMAKPVWMFHSEDDFAIPVEVTRCMAARFRAAGKVEGKDFMLTIYPAEKRYNHGCWDPAYKTPELFTWLMAQKRNG